MNLLEIVILLVIATNASNMGQALAGYAIGGCLASMIVGFIGAFVGVWFAKALGLPEALSIPIQGESFPVLWAVGGSALFCSILGFVARRRRPNRSIVTIDRSGANVVIDRSGANYLIEQPVGNYQVEER